MKTKDFRDIVDIPQGTGRLSFFNGKIGTVEINGEKLKNIPANQIKNRRPAPEFNQ